VRVDTWEYGENAISFKADTISKTEVDWLKKRRNMLGKEALVLYKRGKALPDGILPRYSQNGAGCREIGLQCAAKRWEHD